MSAPSQRAAPQPLESLQSELQWSVDQVKAFQKNTRKARAKWHAYCERQGDAACEQSEWTEESTTASGSPSVDHALLGTSLDDRQACNLQSAQVPLAANKPTVYDPSWAEKTTTVLVQNIPLGCTLTELLMVFPPDGSYKYDFLYFPYNIKRRRSVGFAILNFLSPDTALNFKVHFDGTFMSSTLRYRLKPLLVMPSTVQGLQANVLLTAEKLAGAAMPAAFLPLVVVAGAQALLLAMLHPDCVCDEQDSKGAAKFDFHKLAERLSQHVRHQPIRTPLAMPKVADPDSQDACANMFLSQAAAADRGMCTTGEAIRGHHVDSKDGNWGDLHYSVMMPPRNKSTMFSYSRRPHRWPQQADVGVDGMQPIRTPLAMPKAADPNSQDAHQGKGTTGQAIGGRHVDSEDGDLHDPLYPAMVPSRNESVMVSHSYAQRPCCWPQQADIGVDEMPDPDSQDACVDTTFSQAGDAAGQAIRGRHVNSVHGDWEDPQYFALVPPRASSMPPPCSHARKAALNAYGGRVHNTFLEWQEPALAAL